jgi:hypothetical protein
MVRIVLEIGTELIVLAILAKRRHYHRGPGENMIAVGWAQGLRQANC